MMLKLLRSIHSSSTKRKESTFVTHLSIGNAFFSIVKQQLSDWILIFILIFNLNLNILDDLPHNVEPMCSATRMTYATTVLTK